MYIHTYIAGLYAHWVGIVQLLKFGFKSNQSMSSPSSVIDTMN